MSAAVTQQQWDHVRTALRDTSDRFADVLSSAPPQAKATVGWSVAQTAAHVASIARLYTALLAAEPGRWGDERFQVEFASATVDTIADLNVTMLSQFPERDPRALGAGLRADVAQVLRQVDGWDPASPVHWAGGSRLPVAGVLAHLLNELSIHGWDIARTTGSPWRIPSQDAALFVDLFLVAMIKMDYGSLLDGAPGPRARRIAVELRSGYTATVTLVLRDGRVTAEPAGSDPDVRLRFEPATFNLMMFGRVSKVRALVTRAVVVHGPRPWLLPQFLQTLRMPS